MDNYRNLPGRALLLVSLFPAACLAANCDGALGEWRWFNGGTVALTQQKTVLMNGKAEGKWTCSDPNRNTVVVRWNGGFVDNLTVNGNRLTGKNQQGITVSADRKVTPARK